MGFKRKRVYAGRPKNKRPRKGAKRFKRRSRRSSLNYTSLTTTPHSRLIRHKRTNPRKWKNTLMLLTQAHSHYKSTLPGLTTLTTSTNRLQQNFNFISLFTNTTPFWTAAGGAQP